MKEIVTQPWFDKTESFEIGAPLLMGTDEWGSEVYSLGLAGGQQAMVPALRQFLDYCGVAGDETEFLDTLKGVGVLMRIGGFTSRRLKLIPVGRPVVTLGTWQKYLEFVRLARAGRAASQAAATH